MSKFKDMANKVKTKWDNFRNKFKKEYDRVEDKVKEEYDRVEDQVKDKLEPIEDQLKEIILPELVKHLGKITDKLEDELVNRIMSKSNMNLPLSVVRMMVKFVLEILEKEVLEALEESIKRDEARKAKLLETLKQEEVK